MNRRDRAWRIATAGLAIVVIAAALAWFAQIASVRPAAQPFTLIDQQGQVHRLTDYRGRVLVLNFWAPWCGPCRRELPLLDALARTRAQAGVRVLGITVDAAAPAVTTMLATHPVSYPITRVGQGETWQQRYAQTPQAASAIPYTVIVDRSGRIASRLSGELTTRRLSDALAPLLGDDLAK